jgi:hypothetical protein
LNPLSVKEVSNKEDTTQAGPASDVCGDHIIIEPGTYKLACEQMEEALTNGKLLEAPLTLPEANTHHSAGPTCIETIVSKDRSGGWENSQINVFTMKETCTT